MFQRIAELELENQRLKEYIKELGKLQVVTDIKLEACSVTAPNLFSEKEIECVALHIVIQGGNPDLLLFIPHIKYYSCDDIKNYYLEKAVPWFCNMAKTYRFDLRVTNPNPFVVKNMDVEQHFFDVQHKEFPHNDQCTFAE